MDATKNAEREAGGTHMLQEEKKTNSLRKKE